MIVEWLKHLVCVLFAQCEHADTAKLEQRITDIEDELAAERERHRYFPVADQIRDGGRHE